MNATAARTGPLSASLLIARHADVLVTMDAQRREISDGALMARGGVIEWLGATADLPARYRDAIGQPNMAHSVINGHVVVEDGRLTTPELDAHLTVHGKLALELAQAARAVPASA